MLLNEILTTPEHNGEQVKHKPFMASHMSWPAGAHRQEIHPSKEDADATEIQAFIKRIPSIPVAAAYVLPQKPKVGEYDRENMPITQDEVDRISQLKDAIKMRSPLYVMDEEDVRDVARKAVAKITSLKNTDKALKGKHSVTLKTIFAVQRALKSSNAVLVPLASSSKLASILAHEASSKLGIPVIDGFEKRVGRTSKYYWTKSRGYEERPNFSADEQTKLDQLEAMMNKLHSSKASPEQIEQIEQEYVKTRNKALRQSTKGRGEVDHRRGIYGTQEVAKEEMLDLDGKDVILVDDNVYQGLTIQDAALALARIGIIPNSVSGIAIHQFY